MWPASSVSDIILGIQKVSILTGKIKEDQVIDYAARSISTDATKMVESSI
jgi:hypothetical protein